MGADVFDVERAADHRFQCLVGGIALWNVELGVAQVADARREAEAQEVHQREDVIREPCRVGVVLLRGPPCDAIVPSRPCRRLDL